MTQMTFAMRRYASSWKERTVLVGLIHLAALVLIYAVLGVMLDPNRAYFFNEYTLKFVPFLRDAKGLGWFDAWAMGDPRPRIVTVAAAVLDLRVRELWSHYLTLPPALGINWLTYPATLWFFYRGLSKMRLGREVALGACVLWAVSPPALDSLTLCYVPAKALINLFFAMAINLVVSLDLSSEATERFARRPILQAVSLSVVLLLALLTDETAFVIIIFVVLAFYPFFFAFRKSVWAWLSILGALVAFLIVAFFIYPEMAWVGGFLPLDFLHTTLHGSAAFDQAGTPTAKIASLTPQLTAFADRFSPLGVGFTMFTASLIPNRVVPGFWTWVVARGPETWPLVEVGALFVFLSAALALAFRLPLPLRVAASRLSLALLGLILAYAILIIPLTPAILEINYYGALFSFPFAMVMSIIIVGSARTTLAPALSFAMLALLTILEARSYEATSQRIRRNYSNYETFWNQQEEVKWDNTFLAQTAETINRGGFESFVAAHPYPSRAFSYAFELEANRRHRAGLKVDFQPLAPVPRLFDTVLKEHNQLLGRIGLNLRNPELPRLPQFLTSGGMLVPKEAIDRLVQKTRWTGAGRDWHFVSFHSREGRYTERRAPMAVARTWQVSGLTQVEADGTLVFLEPGSAASPPLTIGKSKDRYFAFFPDGLCAFSFTIHDASSSD